MNRFFLFLKKIYVPLLFVIFEVLAINYYAGSSSYTRAKLLGATNAVAGGVFRQFTSVKHYFGLKKENRLLTGTLAELRNELETYKALHPDSASVVLPDNEIAKYFHSTATVVNNTISKRENFMTIDKGLADGVEAYMAVVTPEGTIAGIVTYCSERFSECTSILNVKFRTAGRLAGTDHFGSIYWDGAAEDEVMLTEVSKYANISPGDTVVTDYSSIFPPNIVIGTVESSELVADSYFDIRVKLTTPPTSFRNVMLVRYSDQLERNILEQQALQTH